MTSAVSTSELAEEYLVSERLVKILRRRWNNFTELQQQAFMRKVKGS